MTAPRINSTNLFNPAEFTELCQRVSELPYGQVLFIAERWLTEQQIAAIEDGMLVMQGVGYNPATQEQTYLIGICHAAFQAEGKKPTRRCYPGAVPSELPGTM